MKRKNEKGFALVLSLLLLLVMSLMGGALIVVSSGDHQSNNSSDEYQQAFYVAETALLEAEKSIINKTMGPWTHVESLTPDLELTSGETTEFDEMKAIMGLNANGGYSRYIDERGLPINVEDTISGLNRTTPCFNSFRNISKANSELKLITYETDSEGNEIVDAEGKPIIESETEVPNFLVTEHKINLNFGTLIAPVFENEAELDSIAAAKDAASEDSNIIANEKTHMERFRYEYFSVNIGSATYRGAGSSLKKTSTNVQTSGSAYKIYGCGYMMPRNTASDKFDDPDILIPLESVVVLSN
jgi:hypothetical protein